MSLFYTVFSEMLWMHACLIYYDLPVACYTKNIKDNRENPAVSKVLDFDFNRSF